MPIKTLKFHLHDERQVEAIDAAIDAAKRVKGLPDNSSALAHICVCHMRLQWRRDRWDLAPDGLASIFAAFLNRLDKNAAREIMKAVHANVTTTSRPSPRLSRPAVIGGAWKWSSRLDAA